MLWKNACRSCATCPLLRREQQHAGLLRAGPADGETGGEQCIAAQGGAVQRAVCAGGIRGELGDGIARGGIQPAQGDAGVLVGVDSLRGVRFIPDGRERCSDALRSPGGRDGIGIRHDGAETSPGDTGEPGRHT